MLWIKPFLSEINAKIVCANPGAKGYMSQLLVSLFTSDEFYESDTFEQFEKSIFANGPKEILDFKPVLRPIFSHLNEDSFMIDVDFIETLGNRYLRVIGNRRPLRQ